MKRRSLVSLLLCLALCACLFPACFAEEITVPQLTLTQRPIPDNEAMTFLKSMGVGWNLGNTFDAEKGAWNRDADEMTVETSWLADKAETTEEMFIALKSAGYSTVRIPVSWHDHVDETYQISERWLARVQQVIDWALGQDLYVILNIHHDEAQFLPASSHYDESARYIQTIWTQLAARFRDYDHRLIFESMNEPRLLNSRFEWTFDPSAPECQDAADCLNRLNQLFVDTVRAEGGQNADRYLMVPGYAAAPANVLRDSFKIPEDAADNRIIISVHAYTPYTFALQENGVDTFGASAQKTEIVNFMKSLHERYILNGIPVVIGEFGARDKDNLQARVDFTAFYTAAASARNIPCLWWDNGAFSGTGEKFRILDRKTCAFSFPQIMEAMMTYGGYDKLPANQQ